MILDDQRRHLLAAAIAFIVLLFVGCRTAPSSGRIVDTNYDRAACEAALAQVESITGMRYSGRGIRVTATRGDKQVGQAWTKANVGAKTTGDRNRQYISLYTDPQGRERPSELLHEMGHAVLWSHGVYGHPATYRGRFERWQD